MFRTLRSSITTNLVLADEPGRDLMQEISPPAGDPGMDARDLEPGLVPVRRALPGAGQPPQRQREPGPVAALVPGIGDLLPGRQGHQRRDPRIDAGDRSAGRMRLPP